MKIPSSAGDTEMAFSILGGFPFSQLSCALWVLLSTPSHASSLPPTSHLPLSIPVPPAHFYRRFPSSCSYSQRSGVEEVGVWGGVPPTSVRSLSSSPPFSALLSSTTSLSLWLAPLLSFPQAPETASASPALPLRGVSEEHTHTHTHTHTHPARDATSWAPRKGCQARAGEENTEGSKSGFSGNEIAPCNNEGATFLTFYVSVHSIVHIVLAPGGNLTSERAEMKWVWVEILCYFTGAERVKQNILQRYLSSGTIPPFPKAGEWAASQLPSRGHGRACCCW